MNTSTINVALVGAGYMAAEHARAFGSLPGVRIAGVCGRSFERARALAAIYGAAVFEDVATMHRATGAAIVVVAVNELAMRSVCEAVFRHPWACLLEKPVGLDLAEAQAIVQAAHQSGTRAFVALNRRAYASTRQAMAELQASDGARLVSVLDQQDMGSAAAGGQPEAVVLNYMYANSIHLVDYFSFFCRGNVADVQTPVSWNAAAPGHVVATVRYDSGDCGVYQAVWDGPGPWSVTVTNRSVRVELRPLERLGVQRRGERRLTEAPADPVDTEFKPGLRWQAEQVLAALMGKAHGLASLDEATRSMTLVADLYGLRPVANIRMYAQRHLPSRVQALWDLERQHDLFAFRHDGWSAWRVMRNAVHRTAMALPISAPPSSNMRRSLQALAATVRLLLLLLFTRQRDVLVKTARSGLRLPLGDHFRDVYFDGLLERGVSHLKLEEINSPDFDHQAARARHPAALDPVVFTFWGRLLGTLFPAPVLPFCERVAKLLAAEVDLEVSPTWLRMRVSTVHWQARLYGLLLARVRPRSVLVSDTGEYALRIAAWRAGARFIELQHGVFDNTHPDAVPIWVTGTPQELVLPDRLACRGAFWIDQLAATRQGRDHAVPVGNELIDGARHERESHLREGPIRLVLTTQGLDSAALAAWTAALIAAAPKALDWCLDLKLHPVYDATTRDYEVLVTDRRVRVVRGAEQPHVFQLLALADLHLSIASACHFDAAALGVPSAVVPLAGHEAMLAAADGDQIFLAHELAEVWRRAEHRRFPPAGTERFATPGFVNNLQRLLG